MQNENRIQLHFLIRPVFLKNRTALKKFLLTFFKTEGKRVEAINYIFCTDKYLLQINQAYLKHNTFTDIITFEISKTHQPLVADIYISVERVRENARTFESSFSRELHRVIFHGAFHLCGYQDKTIKQSLQIRKLEDQTLREYFVSRESF